MLKWFCELQYLQNDFDKLFTEFLTNIAQKRTLYAPSVQFIFMLFKLNFPKISTSNITKDIGLTLFHR